MFCSDILPAKIGLHIPSNQQIQRCIDHKCTVEISEKMRIDSVGNCTVIFITHRKDNGNFNSLERVAFKKNETKEWLLATWCYDNV